MASSVICVSWLVSCLIGCGSARARHLESDAGAPRSDAGRRGPVPLDPHDPSDGGALEDGGGAIAPDAYGPSDHDAAIRLLDDAAASPPTGCTYPSGATGSVSMGQVMSAYQWSRAYREDGTRIAFDLDTFHCDAAWSRYTAVLFVVGTGWCPNCPDYLRWVASLDLASRGTLVVFLESQNASYETASSEDARSTVDRTVGSAPGLRIGEATNAPPDAIGSQISAVPSGIFVRRSDMLVLANEFELGTTPPWAEMAASPDMDWIARLRGGGSGARCTEETLEPNDTRASAAPITPGSFAGGICGANDDYFRVSVAGAWRVDLAYHYADGDLDLFVLDASGRTVVSSESATDHESVSYTGAGIVRVIGYAGARAAYTLSLVAL